MPLSSALVDRVTRKVDASTQVSRETPEYEKAVSVRELLSRLATEKKGSDSGRERIIEIVSASSEESLPRVNGGTISPVNLDSGKNKIEL